ncbi:MAG: hypothetical protein IJW40_09265 [Clostridia bacterium]|nr:hypothetical protein [Clostridia bacterium]
MTSRQLFDAMRDLDDRYITEAVDVNPNKTKVSILYRKNFRTVAAAGLCLVALLAVACVAVPTVIKMTEDGVGETQLAGDINFGFYLNELDYQPMETVDYAHYPALQALQFSGTEEQINEAVESLYLGEQIGTIPADENFGEGTVYRVRQYPTYDSIVIMYRDGKYGFYVSDGNDLNRYLRTTDDRSSSNSFAFHGFPQSILTVKLDLLDEQSLDAETVASLIEIMNNKVEAEYAVYAHRVVDLWQQTYGTDEVSLSESGGLDHDLTDRDLQERLRQLTAPQAIWISNDRGFDELLILYYPKLSMFSFCGVLYELTPDEVSAIDALLGVE